MNDFIVTDIERDGKQYLAAACYRDRVLTELTVRPRRRESQAGKIYVGYVESTVKNIGGAFIRISKDFKCFLPNYRQFLSAGGNPGHMLVMVTKDASGVKEAVCSANIEIAGRYSVLSRGKTSLSISRKVPEEERALFKKWVNPHDYPDCHILLRTNAATADKESVISEITELQSKLDEIYRQAETAKTGACLYTPPSFYMTMLRDLYEKPDRIISNIPAIADEMKEFMPGVDYRPDSSGTLTLSQLYNLNHDLDKLLQKVVWLKSGAYLVIERAEAFVIIDVNSGRCGKGKNPEETYRKINLEAGEEVLRQLRLRELSGMILIDFISLESEERQIELVNVMKKLARKEHRRTEVIDLTKLGILEMVREKKEKPLEEIFES